MPVIMPGVHTNAMQAYDSMMKVKELADIILPLHETDVADMKEVP